MACGYDLRGMSVLGVCPECGTAVRATILAVVDPLADELRPIRHPRVVGVCIVLWSGAALAAVIVAWRSVILEVFGLAANTAIRDPRDASFTWLTACLVWLSGLAAVGLARPHDAVPRRATGLALLSALLSVPAGYLVVMMSRVAGESYAAGLSSLWQYTPGRTVFRCGLFVVVMVMILMMRPVARLLVARSLAMRQGRVDRQTLYAMAMAVGLIVLGDIAGALVLGNLRADEQIYLMIAMVVMALGWILLTIGLVGAVVDCWRIAQAVRTPGIALRHVFDEDEKDLGGVGGEPAGEAHP